MNLNASTPYLERLVSAYRPGWSLEQSFYADPALFEIDIKKVFARYWLCAGHVSRIPRAGDYFTCEIEDESIIVIRADDEHIRANWKLVVENSRECYHCGAGHPQYCRAVGFAAAIDS